MQITKKTTCQDWTVNAMMMKETDLSSISKMICTYSRRRKVANFQVHPK